MAGIRSVGALCTILLARTSHATAAKYDVPLFWLATQLITYHARDSLRSQQYHGSLRS